MNNTEIDDYICDCWGVSPTSVDGHKKNICKENGMEKWYLNHERNIEDEEAFFICPVRGHDMSETIEAIESLEAMGYCVHWPPRDTDQDDNTGFRICKDNENAILRADCVIFNWDGKSQGCLFDLGIAFAYKKKIIIGDIPELTDGKSFQNMATYWSNT